MKNFDDANLDDEARELVPPVRPRVEIVSDPAGLAHALRKAAIAPSISMHKRIAESLSSLDGIKGARENALKAAMGNLHTIDVPKIDWAGLVARPQIDATTRVKPHAIELPKPIRSIADIRLEAIADAANRLIDVAERQNEALRALDYAMEARHAASEELADERAERADNRAAWAVTFAGLAALGVVVEFFFR